MRRFVVMALVLAGAFLTADKSEAVPTLITSLVGDIDCFGLGGACADGFSFGYGTLPGGAPGAMDTQQSASSASYTHNYAAIPGTVLSAVLTLRVWDLGTIGGDDIVRLNGGLALSRPDNFATNNGQVRTLIIDVLPFLQYDGGESLLFDPSSNEVWALDYSQLDITVEPIPEPGTLFLLGSGITGLALRRRRRTS